MTENQCPLWVKVVGTLFIIFLIYILAGGNMCWAQDDIVMKARMEIAAGKATGTCDTTSVRYKLLRQWIIEDSLERMMPTIHESITKLTEEIIKLREAIEKIPDNFWNMPVSDK